jgi:glycosyltransferase involved in cell wall biosynthesis
MRVLYVQYTNPGAYPPVVRGAELLAQSGAEVTLLGVRVAGLDALRVTEGPGLRARCLPSERGGSGIKARYARYAAWATREAMRWRPDWVYASDVLAAPIALAIAALTGARVVYHEHDAPAVEHPSWALRQCLAARRRLVRDAQVVVAPNAARAARLAAFRGGRSVVTAWNCPRRPTDRLPMPRSDHGPLRLAYRGSINAERFPPSIIEAVRRGGSVAVEVVGYETEGSRGYCDQLAALATKLGVPERVRLHGTLPAPHADAVVERCHVGLALMPMTSRDENMRSMAGASNKVFEYLAAGAVPLVSDLPEWRTEFVEPGYAIACDPREPASVIDALAWADRHRADLRAIALRGWERLRADWNYETQFAPVLKAIWGSASDGTPVEAGARREVQCVS